jgi:hypothetical protein
MSIWFRLIERSVKERYERADSSTRINAWQPRDSIAISTNPADVPSQELTNLTTSDKRAIWLHLQLLLKQAHVKFSKPRTRQRRADCIRQSVYRPASGNQASSRPLFRKKPHCLERMTPFNLPWGCRDNLRSPISLSRSQPSESSARSRRSPHNLQSVLPGVPHVLLPAPAH